MKLVAVLVALIALSGCSEPAPTTTATTSAVPATVQQAAGEPDPTGTEFCAAMLTWLQSPALRTMQYAERRGDAAAMRRAARQWLGHTREVLSELPADTPPRVRRTLKVIAAALAGAEGRFPLRPVSAPTRAELRRVLTYVKVFCLGG